MRISSRDFFSGLDVNPRHYLSRFKELGVKSSIMFSEDDLILIRDNYPLARYRSGLVVDRAAAILEGSYVKS